MWTWSGVMCFARSGRWSKNHWVRFLNPLSLSTVSIFRFSTAISGISPTSDRTFSGVAVPFWKIWS